MSSNIHGDIHGDIQVDIGTNQVLVYDDGISSWVNFNQDIMYNYQEMLDNIPIEEIERFLRKKKIERIREI
jgi:hypothetical protein